MKQIQITTKKYVKPFLIVVIAIIFGLCVEGIYEIIQNQKIVGSEITAIEKGQISVENGKTNEEGKLVLTPESKLVIEVPSQYIRKLQYSYNAIRKVDVTLHVYDKNVYNRDVIETFTDRCRPTLNMSTINLNEEISKIEMFFSDEIEVSDFKILNTVSFNWYRVAFYGVLAGISLFLILYGKLISQKVEHVFAILALTIGLLFIALQPPGLISWDEHIHFQDTFSLLNRGENDWKESMDYIYDNPEEFPYVSILSLEEREAQNQLLNEMENPVGKYADNSPYSINNAGYAHMAIVAKILHILNVPFSIAFVLTKAVNLFLYVFLVWLAIRILPTHKMLMAVLALMPTPIIMACAYSYDPTVIGCMFLASSVMLAEYYEVNKKINWKRFALLAGAMILGCCPKAVYIPLILGILFLPKDKFHSVKERRIFSVLVIFVFVAMMFTFVLPTLISSNVEGDARGGNTNVTAQLKLIFSDLFGYLQVFFTDVWHTLPDYLFGKGSMGHLAYSGYLPSAALTGVLAITVAFTDQKAVCPENGKKALRNFKVASLVCIFMVIGLIWTALYLSFTEVGMTTIAGVQGRYYLPFLFLLFYIIGDVRIENKMSIRAYRTIVFALSVFMLFQMLYKPIYLTYCQ